MLLADYFLGIAANSAATASAVYIHNMGLISTIFTGKIHEKQMLHNLMFFFALSHVGPEDSLCLPSRQGPQIPFVYLDTPPSS